MPVYNGFVKSKSFSWNVLKLLSNIKLLHRITKLFLNLGNFWWYLKMDLHNFHKTHFTVYCKIDKEFSESEVSTVVGPKLRWSLKSSSIGHG